MTELPYATLPFSLDGSDAEVQQIEASATFRHHCFLISGIRSDDDVMRGEETQLIGCTDKWVEQPGKHIFIFPGTHSKHITVNENNVSSFKTYMTGEFFDLLSKKSLLHASVEFAGLNAAGCLNNFIRGVRLSRETNLLHTSFITRTNLLFNKLNKKENYNFLSGLLIGAELQDLISCDAESIRLCSDSHLHEQYETALAAIDKNSKTEILSIDSPEDAVVRGQHKIFTQHISK
jgi:2-dehydro-3-deoxygalactonokinase